MNDFLTIYNQLLPNLDIYNVIKIRKICKEFYHLFKILNFNTLIKKFHNNDKIGKFNFLVYNFSYLPMQGTEDWLNQRKGLYKDAIDDYIKIPKQYTVGGSEISTLLCVNPYSSIRTMAERKFETINSFKGNINTRWGNMFEPIITKYTEIYFKTSIKEFGSIPILFDKNKSPVSRYSPDGIAIISKENLRSLETDIVNNNNIVLFEFKCPIRRNVKDTVPIHYINQPLIGMAGIDIIDFSIFGDAVFRKCSLTDFGFNKNYDKIFHNTDWRIQFEEPILCGLIFIHENCNNSYYHNIHKNVSNLCKKMKTMGYDIDHLIDYIFSICKENNIYDLEFIQTLINVPKMNNIIKIIHKYFTNNYDLNLLKINNDLGDNKKNCVDNFDKVMEDIDNDNLHTDYSYNWFYNHMDINEYLFNNISKMKLKYNEVSVLPYKLFNLKYIVIEKDKNYLKKYSQEIYNFVDKIQKIRNNTSTMDLEFPTTDSDHVKYAKTIKKFTKPTNVNTVVTYTKENKTYVEMTDSDEIKNIM